MVAKRLIATLVAILLGSSFQFGYQTGVTNNPEMNMKNFATKILNERNKYTDTLLHIVSSLWNNMWVVGGLIGGVVGGIMARMLGRKLSLDIMAAPMLLGCLLMMISIATKSFEVVIVGRFFSGLTCGAAMVIGPMYLSEVTPVSIRGAVGTSNQLVITIAISLSQILGIKYLMNTPSLWPFLLGLNFIMVIIYLILFRFVPESPRFTYLVKNDKETAKSALTLLNQDQNEADKQFAEMEEEKANSVESASIRILFYRPELRFSLFIAVTAQLVQQLSGINAVIYYSTSLYKKVGLSEDNAVYANIGLGLLNIVVTIVSIVLVERAGRKLLLIVGASIMMIAQVLFTVFNAVSVNHNIAWLSYLSIAMTYLIIVGFGIGPGPIPWFLVVELFTTEYRDAAATIACVVNWLGNLIVSLIFPIMVDKIENYAFLPFTVVLLITTTLLGVYQPETKGRTAESVAAEMKRKYGSGDDYFD